jgi:hypothetical protein
MNIAYYDLTEIADQAGLLDDHSASDVVRADYSGRGMYGRTCISITLDHTSQLLNLGAAIASVLGDVNALGGAAIDGMGTGLVCYFSQAACNDAPAESWDEDDEDEE